MSTSVEILDDRITSPALLGPWALMWRKFRRHKLAFWSLIIVILVYVLALFGEFFAPMAIDKTYARRAFAPPMPIRFFVEDENGESSFRLHARDLKVEIDREVMRRSFVEDPEKIIELGSFVRGWEYELLWLFPTDIHLFGSVNPRDRAYILGADRLGRDILSRIIMGTRISMSVGLVGVAISLVIGVSLGGISGYYGGWIDNLIQRLIEFIRSIQTILLWMGLAAAIPLDWPPLRTYFVVTIIVSMIGWTSLAREVRGKFLALRNEDFVIAARLDCLTDWQVIREHMAPLIRETYHRVAYPRRAPNDPRRDLALLPRHRPATPYRLLGHAVGGGTEHPHHRRCARLLIASGSVIVATVLALNFLGDGMRDAADPHAH